jgi:RNA polymerase sigma factor (sigma-70 family)
VHLAEANGAHATDNRDMGHAPVDCREDLSDGERLVVAAQRNRGRREELIAAYRPLIAGVARHYRRCGTIEREELMQQGIVGLLNALERYDASLGTPFWAYAAWWVRQAMQQMVAELAGPVVLSDRAQRHLARLNAARHAYGQQHRREPAKAELAAAAKVDERHVDSLMAAATRARGFDEPIADREGAGSWAELLADATADDDFERVCRRTAAAGLPALLCLLDERERFVVSGRFGLDGDERTLSAIADELGVSAERVRQIERAALDTLTAACTRPPAQDQACGR